MIPYSTIAPHLETTSSFLSVTVRVRALYIRITIRDVLTRPFSPARSGTRRSAPASSQKYRGGSRTMRQCSPPRSFSSSSSSAGSTSATQVDTSFPRCIARYVGCADFGSRSSRSFVGPNLACNGSHGTAAPCGENRIISLGRQFDRFLD